MPGSNQIGYRLIKKPTQSEYPAMQLTKWDNYGIIIPRRKEADYMPQIMPIKDLKDTSYISEMCHKAEEPIYITKNGYGDMVVMSIELFESLQRKWNMYSDIELSEQQIKEEKTKDARKALSAMREKYGL